MIEPEDLRAAIARGIVTEDQAARLTALAEARRTGRATAAPAEEPFVLFKGFNEIFIVIGLVILFSGWLALTAMAGADWLPPVGPVTVAVAAGTFAGLMALSRYFTLARRMVAPSIALAVMAALVAGAGAHALVRMAGLASPLADAAAWAIVAAAMALHYRIFRVPFSAAIIASAVFYALWLMLQGPAEAPAEGADLFGLVVLGPFSWLSLLFGIAAFAVALRFDLSDPLRVTTRAATGFWLHVVAAPAIVNPVAVALLGQEGVAGQGLLALFLLVLAVVAVAIDRRSFLVSGAAYAVVLAMSVFDGSPLVILALGLGLVLLGAQWERLRARLMTALPPFPGKDRLPPWGATP
jgi:hypothetical protein